MQAALLGLLATLSVILLFVGVGQALFGRRSAIQSRLQRYGVPRQAPGAGEENPDDALIEAIVLRTEQLWRASGLPSRIEVWLSSAYLDWSIGRYSLVVAVSLLVAFSASWVAFHSSTLALFLSPLGLVGVHLYLWQRRGNVAKALQEQLLEGIVLLANAIRSGYTIIQAIEVISRQCGPILSRELSRVILDIKVGLSLENALENLARRTANEDMELFVTLLLIHHRAGGNLALLLDSLAATLRERIEIRGEIKLLTAQQRLSTYVLMLLPVIVGLALTFLNPRYMEVLIFTTLGRMMLGTAIIMLAVGYMVLQRVGEVEV